MEEVRANMQLGGATTVQTPEEKWAMWAREDEVEEKKISAINKNKENKNNVAGEGNLNFKSWQWELNQEDLDDVENVPFHEVETPQGTKTGSVSAKE